MAETVGDLQTAALPLYVQRLGQLLNISPLLDNVEKVFATSDIKQTKRLVIHILLLVVLLSIYTDEDWYLIQKVVWMGSQFGRKESLRLMGDYTLYLPQSKLEKESFF